MNDVTIHVPKLEFITSGNDEANAAANMQLQMQFKPDFDGYMKRKHSLETYMTQA
jgi:hypothetical protein